MIFVEVRGFMSNLSYSESKILEAIATTAAAAAASCNAEGNALFPALDTLLTKLEDQYSSMPAQSDILASGDHSTASSDQSFAKNCSGKSFISNGT
ncbi:unnamed protein product [Protopolystoma xenopodis]|uniref:Uncharacterized protein n=1 Tax=Protopolystoma xenopodis TaxID=117903 RepID=A0A448X6J9_9PLAT|nr:unnamed protein product [Protopolystoma xenopodis]